VDSLESRGWNADDTVAGAGNSRARLNGVEHTSNRPGNGFPGWAVASVRQVCDGEQQCHRIGLRGPPFGANHDQAQSASLLISTNDTMIDLKHLAGAGLCCLAMNSGFSRPPSAIVGSYVTITLNGHALPADVRVPVTDGAFRLFTLEQGVLRLSSDGKFTLYFRYYHQLVRRGARPAPTPVMSDSEKGTYSFDGIRITLVPEKRRNGQSRPNIVAVLSGDELSASYVLRTNGSPQRIALLLHRDPRYW
jgi:hypothetical protein